MKKCTMSGFGVYRKFGLICFTKLFCNVQPKSGTLFSGGKKWLKYFTQLCLVDAWAVVCNGDDTEAGSFIAAQGQTDLRKRAIPACVIYRIVE